MIIGKKISLAFVSLALLAGTISIISIITANNINKHYGKVEKEEIPSLTSLMNIQNSARQASLKVIEYSLRRNDRDKLKTQEALNKLELDLNTFRLTAEKKNLKLFLTLNKKYNTFKAEINKLLLLSADSSLKTLTIEEDKVYQARKELIHFIYPIIETKHKELKNAGVSTKKTINITIVIILISGLGLIFLAVVLGFTVSRSISLPINKLTNITHEIGNGKFDTKFSINSKDEVGVLAHSFKVMTKNLLKSNIDLLQKTSELDQIFNSAADGMRIIDFNFNVLHINNTLSKMLEGNKRDFIGKKCFEIFPGSLCNTPQCPVKKMVKEKKTYETETEKRCPDGKTISCILSVTPFTKLDGKVIGIVEDFKNITERKKQDEELRKNEAQLKKINIQLEDAHRHAMYMLAIASEYKDPETGMHIKHLVQLTTNLALKMGFESKQAEHMGENSILHDLGKLGISDYILLKPGKLTDNEFETMKQHTTIGAKIIGDDEWFRQAYLIALSHHERWDGNGYPQGLKGESIPIAARIVAVADTFDALISKRPYKEAWTIKKAIDEIKKKSGKYFDPKVVEAFLSLYKKEKLKKYLEH
jgi:PAS domain S-box-containing protein